MATTQNEDGSFTQTVGETNIDWSLALGSGDEVVVNASGSHFDQAPILTLLTGGNGQPTGDVRLPEGFRGNWFVRVGGVVKFHVADGVVTEV